ncbi:MAG: hypothetical protein O3A85_14760 [Proteobacteria bacterium]|nr:hypothetical protein [Pseudomonadota bacterium]
MLLNKVAILEVARHADSVDRDASVHWTDVGPGPVEHPLKRDPFNLVYGPAGFSSIGPIGAVSMKTSFRHRLIHWLLQLPTRMSGLEFESYAEVRRAADGLLDRQGRIFDNDVLRHALTMALILDRLPLRQEADPIAVIGDGFGTMTALILETLPSTKIITVNLTKTLLVDLAFLYKAFPDCGYAYVETAADMRTALAEPSVRVVALRADYSEALASVPIILGINILSMMEMMPSVTARYFDVLRRCPRRQTAFYCCNRVEKRLADGTVTRFLEYPWRAADDIVVDGPCPWTRIAYRGWPPFFYRSNPVQHRLAWLEKS